MNVYLIQFDVAWEDRQANRSRILSLVSAAKPIPGSLIVLPETAFSGFSFDVAAAAQSSSQEDENFLAQIAVQYQCTVTGGVISRMDDSHGANQSVTFSPDGALLARYTKLQPFSPGGEEKSYPAGHDMVTFDYGGFKAAPFICYDLRFPELFRAATRCGADLFIVIASWPARRHHHWLTLLQARAIENQACVIGVNRLGQDPNASYNGRSVVVSPHGHLVADAGESEQVLVARIDADEVRRWRAEFPALKDMR